jgi:hypothetical protein
MLEGLEGSLEGLFSQVRGLSCGRGRIGRIFKPTPQHARLGAHMYEYGLIILPILPSLDSMRVIGAFNPSKHLPHPSNLQKAGDKRGQIGGGR